MIRRHFMKGFGAGLISSGLIPSGGITPAQAKLRQPVTWGGIYQDETADLPNLRAAMQMRNANNQTINGLLVRMIRQVNWSDTNIDLAPLADQSSDIETDLGMATVFVAEQDLAAVYFPDLHKTRYINRLVGYNMIYNVRKREIVANFGIIGRYFDSKPGKPNSDVLPSIYFDLITNQNRQDSIAQHLVTKVARYPYANKYGGKRFQVTQVSAKPMADGEAQALNMDISRFLDQIGHMAGVYFSSNLNVPVIPFVKTKTLNLDLVKDMRIVAVDGNSALNTTLPLPDPEMGIEIELDGWNFQEKPYTNQRRIVTLVLSLKVSIKNVNSGQVLFQQSYYAEKQQFEIPSTGYLIQREASVYLLHEELLYKVFESFANPSSRDALYEGFELKQDGENTFLQASSEDKQLFENEHNAVIEHLPFAMGS